MKVLIGAGAVMLVMLLLGFVMLNETGRMKTFAAAADGRAIEQGAIIYETYCVECHGINGLADECFNTFGNPIPCRGLPLNSFYLFCEDRKEEMRFTGTNEQFVKQTIAFGRPGTEMPAWSVEFGGPLSRDQIRSIVSFILNWEGNSIIECQEITPFWPQTVEEFLVLDIDEPINFRIEPGNVERGQQAYLRNGCNACHGLLGDSGSNTIGTWLGNLKETGSTRIEGVSTAQYVYESILDPNAFIAPDCPFGPCPEPSLMPTTYVTTFWRDPQELADLLAYLLGAENLPGMP